MIHRRSLLVFLTLSLSGSALLAKPKSGIVSSDFDGKPSGARYIGMGETGAALSGMPESPLWNPAALQDISGPVFSVDFDVARQSQIKDDILLQNVSLRGRRLTYMGFAGPGNAFFFRPLASYNRRTITNSADPLNNFIDQSLKITQFGLSGAHETSEGNSLGISLSYLNARYGYAQAATSQPPVLRLADGNGFTLDIGVRTRKDYYSYGLALFNAPGVLYWNVYRPDQLPMLLRGGVAFHPVSQFAFTTDYEKRFYRGGLPKPDFLHLGMEFTLLPWFQIRGGTYGEDLNNVDKTIYTTGFTAVSPGRHQLDFALRSYRFQKERVYNYFISILFPLPQTEEREKASPQKPPVFFPKKLRD